MSPHIKLQLLETLGHLNVRLAAHVSRLLPEGGLSIARYRILRFIDAQEPTTAGEIRSFFGLAPRTVTEVVNALERDRLIRRARDPQDQRVSRLTMLPAGTQALEKSGPALAGAAETAFSDLTADEQDQLLHLLNRVLEKVG